MTMEEALVIVKKQLDDYTATAENYEYIFPGSVSAFRELVDAYTLAVEAMKKAAQAQ